MSEEKSEKRHHGRSEGENSKSEGFDAGKPSEQLPHEKSERRHPERSEVENSKSEGIGDRNPDEHFSEDKGAPGQPQTSNIVPIAIGTQTESMEVHHHGHVHNQKRWKEYLFQFFMLFLAVLCGFLAEYQLEHTIEHQREKEFAQALYDEFLEDSISVADKITARLDKEKDCEYLSTYISDSSLTDLPKAFYPAYTTVFYLINSYKFEPKDGVLSQMKNSGSLRYFKSAALQKLFGDINVAINNVRNRNEQEYQFFADPIKPFMVKHYDFKWANELRKASPDAYNMDLIIQYRKGSNFIKADILNPSTFDRKEVVNIVMFYKAMLHSTRTLQMNEYVKANHKLLQALRDNYSLTNE